MLEQYYLNTFDLKNWFSWNCDMLMPIQPAEKKDQNPSDKKYNAYLKPRSLRGAFFFF